MASIISGLVQYHPDLEPLMVDIDAVRQWPGNYNNGDVEEIAQSIEINGMYRPVYAQRSTGYILAGNHTWEACKSLDARTIPVIFLDLDDEAATRIAIADNEIARLARPDNSALLELLEQLDASGGMLGTGLGERDLLQLRELVKMENTYDQHATWPTITVQVPPHVRAAYWAMTEHAVGDRERFELLMRLAGWDGRKPS